MDLVLLLCAGILGGALNSLAGGGSFIVFPALLLVGVPPVMANATNTFAALPGYISGAFGFRKDILKYRSRIVPYTIIALIGGYLGAELLLKVDDAQFSQVVPWLMALATLLFSFGGTISNWVAANSGTKTAGRARAGTVAILALLLLVCLYGGFFNAGLGIILLAFFALAGLTDIHAMNGLKLMISALVAIIAVVRFGFSGSIAWYQGTLAFVGTMIGGYGAARIAHKIPTRIIRLAIIAYAGILTLIFFWQAYA